MFKKITALFCASALLFIGGCQSNEVPAADETLLQSDIASSELPVAESDLSQTESKAAVSQESSSQPESVANPSADASSKEETPSYSPESESSEPTPVPDLEPASSAPASSAPTQSESPSVQQLNTYAPEYGEPEIYIEALAELQKGVDEVSYPREKDYTEATVNEFWQSNIVPNEIMLTMYSPYAIDEDQFTIEDFESIKATRIKEIYAKGVKFKGLKFISLTIDADRTEMLRIVNSLKKYDCIQSVAFNCTVNGTD